MNTKNTTPVNVVEFNGVDAQTRITFDRLSPKSLRTAARMKEKIEQLEGRLNRLLLGRSSQKISMNRPRKHRMSAAGRRAISLAAKRRWRKFHREQAKAA